MTDLERVLKLITEAQRNIEAKQDDEDVILIGETMSIARDNWREDYRGLDGEIHQRMVNGWIVEQANIIPGVMYMPNGDPGYPDEMELVEISRHKTLELATIAAIQREIQLRCGDMMDSWVEEV